MSEVRAGHAGPARAVLEEERDFFLRSLRDLESERAAGDIDDVDYAALRSDYTARAAAVLRRLEALDAPQTSDGSAEYAPEGDGSAGDGSAGGDVGPALAGGPEATDASQEPPPAVASSRRWRRGRRRVAAVTVAAALAAGGIAWAVVAATGTRLPGEVASGQAVGQEQVAKLLLAAQQATAKGDAVTALKDLQAVLKQNPNQVEALASEGWILAQTQQPQLLTQGIGMLSRAVRVDPTYPPARVYRGVSYLAEGDYANAVSDLQWYLAHNPDPALVARVRQALAQAQAGAARKAPTVTTPQG
ncbi:hypothetical protein K6U06_15865 [Acidiferrimicrobium sp. IK]|uniref:tetratricopeptide repeat protein n=1 Tax=Acidiferrimicrobium sp. IK TaxID=2871700 RepID=UPI0021CB5E47|nr:tetratricopeptide repeat protein [Acidiferrimicrobium sp. IK]MCU4185846.1 hypothetical protein [Acidiferrimicrobium sp. IK]